MIRKINLRGEINAVQGSEGGDSEAVSRKASGSWSDTWRGVVLLAERIASVKAPRKNWQGGLCVCNRRNDMNQSRGSYKDE